MIAHLMKKHQKHDVQEAQNEQYREGDEKRIQTLRMVAISFFYRFVMLL